MNNNALVRGAFANLSDRQGAVSGARVPWGVVET
jgi:hypothetical protein